MAPTIPLSSDADKSWFCDILGKELLDGHKYKKERDVFDEFIWPDVLVEQKLRIE